MRGQAKQGVPRPLLIAGCGGFGRETLEAVRASNQVEERWNVLGFLDDDPTRSGKVVSGVTVIGPLEIAADRESASVVVTIGNPQDFAARYRIVQRLGLPAERYATIVHPAATVAHSTSVGHGSVVLAGAVTTSDVTIGAHVTMMPAVVLTHDVIVDDFATLTTGVHLAGGVHVGRGAYVGAGALLREHLQIGPWAMIGMGAAVTRDVPAGEVWAGVPAQFLRRVVVVPHDDEVAVVRQLSSADSTTPSDSTVTRNQQP